MVLCTSYGYGISEKMLVREKDICPDSGKRDTRSIFCSFSYKEEVTLLVKEQIICSVDLGSIPMQSAGRRNCPGKKIQRSSQRKRPMYRTLGRIRRFQREHGSAQTQEDGHIRNV